MSNDIKDSLERFYVSTSELEIRMSEMTHGTDRLPYITILYMDLIGFNPGITSSQIAERLGVTKATVTSTVNRLVDKGYVVRERSEEDGRVRPLRLSERTRDDYELESRLIARVATRMAEEYPPDEVRAFCSMLDRASELMTEFSSEAVPCEDGDGLGDCSRDDPTKSPSTSRP